ncbi:MAG: hypothetical protein FJ267_18475 [Planctomycetes bacterium]|nr:hypothetical protein [Planctomycetota bacterium]
MKTKVAELERELENTQTDEAWSPSGFYFAYYATTGFLLGGFAALVALIVNMIGAPLAGRHPMELIRVYLTFPLGEKALQLASIEGKSFAVDDGLLLILGCCLYLATGMILGIGFQLALMAWAKNGGVVQRLIVSSVLAILVWLVAFYAILSWLQPLLFGGNWIVDTKYLPIWVAAGTHLVFGWMMAILSPLGEFTPYTPVHSESKK